jgi:tetratricopeptide (TPR) repeat protein
MSDSTEDLSARARRGELHDADRRRLRLALESSLEARLLHRAGCEFDAGDTVLPGDDELADRIARRTLAGRDIHRRSRARVWIFAAAAACMTAGAAAAVGPITRALGGNDGKSEGRAVKVKVDPPPRRAPAPAERVIPETAPSLSASAATELEAPSPERPKLLTEPAGPKPRVGAQSADDASSLFARANLARREQRIEEAIVLYQQVERRFPRSAEARASGIALGTLQLKAANASASLRHYRRYLAENPNGELSPEALWGEAQSLSALGRTNEARQSWRLLIERFPESVYAKSARFSLERTR